MSSNPRGTRAQTASSTASIRQGGRLVVILVISVLTLLFLWVSSSVSRSLVADDSAAEKEALLRYSSPGRSRDEESNRIRSVPKDDGRGWANFDLTLSNTADCAKFIEDGTYLENIGNVVVREWLRRRHRNDGTKKLVDEDGESYKPPSSKQLQEAESAWMRAMEACHGPLPLDVPELAEDLTAIKWMQRVELCRTMTGQGTAEEVCLIGISNTVNETSVDGKIKGLTDWFAFMARCAFHQEFPLTPPSPEDLAAAPPLREQRPGWRPQRLVIIAVSMGIYDSSSACMLVNTAFSRGHELVVAEGEFRGLRHKFEYTIHAMDLALSYSEVAEEDTLILFADSFDSAVQQGPDYIIEAFLDQPYFFVWGGEHNCFPLGSWPFGVTAPGDACQRLFPEAPPDQPALVHEQRFLNAGGWIAAAPAARTLLQELSKAVFSSENSNWPDLMLNDKGKIRPTPAMKWCHDRGTDQVMAQTAFLRHRRHIGLDTQSRFIANDPRYQFDNLLQAATTKDNRFPAWCYDATENGIITNISDSFDPCPAVLHFGGVPDDDEYMSMGVDIVMGKNYSDWGNNDNVCSNGTFAIVNLDTEEIQHNVEHKDSKREWPCEKPPIPPCRKKQKTNDDAGDDANGALSKSTKKKQKKMENENPAPQSGPTRGENNELAPMHPRYEEGGEWANFDLTLTNTEACAKFIEDDKYLENIGNVVVREWLSRQSAMKKTRRRKDFDGKTYRPPSSKQLQEAESAWMRAMDACHGPFFLDNDPELAEDLTAIKWMERLELCRVLSELGTGEEVCILGFGASINATNVGGKVKGLTDWFVFTARCGFHLEFPLAPPASSRKEAAEFAPLREQRPGWRPQRMVIISIAMGSFDTSAACMLVNTAFSRGHELVVAEGEFRGLRHKFEYAQHTMDLALSYSDVAEEDTLVLFADSVDSVVQQGPEYFIEAFLDQPYFFVWGSEHNCFPLGTWPYGVTKPQDACHRLFPEAPPDQPALVREKRYLNAGGWIGMIPAARTLLRELGKVVESTFSSSKPWPELLLDNNGRMENFPAKRFCHDRGTDQFLAQASFLRHRRHIGLDTQARFVANDPRFQFGNVLQENTTKDEGFPAWCYDATENGRIRNVGDSFDPCPAILHFGGASNDDEYVVWGFETALGRNHSVWKDRKCSEGTLTIVNLDTEKVQRNVQRKGSKRKWPCKKPPIPPCQKKRRVEKKREKPKVAGGRVTKKSGGGIGES